MAGIQHGRKDKLMRADWKQCALFITFSLSPSITLTLSSLALNHNPSVNVAVIFHCVDSFIVTQTFYSTFKIVVEHQNLLYR